MTNDDARARRNRAARQRRQQARQDPWRIDGTPEPPRRQQPLPIQPLLDYISSLNIHPATAHHIAKHTGLSRKTLIRAIDAGQTTVWLADQLAHSYGIHPAEIYGDAWLQAGDLRTLRINRAFGSLRNEVAS